MTSLPPRDQERLLEQLGWIRALAGRLVAQPDVADDVLQRVCLLALERPPRPRLEDSRWRAWLSAATRSLAGHAARSEGRRARRERAAARDERLPATVDVAARRELLRHLVDAVTGLDEPHFSSIVLRYSEGLSVAEMAQRLGLTRQAVRQRLVRARHQLRGQLERRLGPERERWLAALAPLAHGATRATVLPAAPGTLVPSIAQSLGGLAMAKSATLVATQLAVGAGLLSAVALTLWLALDETPPPPAPLAPVVERSVPAVPAATPPADLQSRTAETLDVPASPDRALALDPPSAAEPALPLASLAAGTTQLDQAALSCLTETPDLLALQRALWELAQSATVVANSVARNPDDGSVSGWLDIAGAEERASFTIDADGDYRIALQTQEAAALQPPFVQRDLQVSLRDDAGAVTEAGVTIQFHPNTSEANWAQLLETIADGQPRHVGWGLAIGPDGTQGNPLAMQRLPDEDGLTIGPRSSLPALDARWATDTSAHAAWLALLRPHAP